MAYPVLPIGLLGGQQEFDPYRIERSLRFSGIESEYLNRTFTSPTSQSIFTLSFWMKLGTLGTARTIFAVSTNHSLNLTTGNALNLTFAGTSALTTTALLRDPSAWYHVVWTQSGTSHTIYINNTNVGTATATSNTFNTGVAHLIGASNTTTPANFLSGYLTEIHFIDGLALQPASFGETNPFSGRWVAKRYSGNYGVNGFFLNFSDRNNTSSLSGTNYSGGLTTLGKDFSGMNNNWTPNNFSLIGGPTHDSVVDSPSDYGVDNGNGGEVRGNYATLNPISHVKGTINYGNLRTSGGDRGSISTIGLTSGKWYCEYGLYQYGTESSFGISSGLNVMNTMVGSSSDSIGFQFVSGNIVRNGIVINSTSSPAEGMWVGMELDLDSNPNTLRFIFYAGIRQQVSINLNSYPITKPIFIAASGRTTGTANEAFLNFGQYEFENKPNQNLRNGKEFKAICSTNLNPPIIKNAKLDMDVITYNGNASSITFSGIGFSPDLVWIKGSSGTTDHAIYDSNRGVQRDLGSNITTDETIQSQGLTGFNVDGFSIGNLAKINTSSASYVAWVWDESSIAGLDIVNYTGSGANRTIAHNLGVAPRMIIVKARTTAGADQGWPVYHASLANTQYLMLNTTAAAATGADYWNSTTPTSSVFSLGTNAAVNANNDTYIAYCFTEVEGFSMMRSYTGNANADGTFIWCGFRPAFIMIKSSTAIDSWLIYDNKRNTVNVSATNLVPNTNAANATISGIDFLSNGFKLRTVTTTPNAAQTYIFAAFAEAPFKYARAR